jgi:uroporphyrinogen decarboxylase
MIDPEILKKWYINRAKKFYEPAINEGIPIIFDCDGDPSKIMDMIFELEASALFPIDANGMDYREAKKKYGDRICLYGGIDTDIVIRGTTEETEEYVRDVVTTLKEGGRFIAGTISDVNEMPFENFVTMINTIHKHGIY